MFACIPVIKKALAHQESQAAMGPATNFTYLMLCAPPPPPHPLPPGLANIAALSLAIDYPTLASIPHSVINGYKNVLAVALETDVLFPQAEKVCGCVENESSSSRAMRVCRLAEAIVNRTWQPIWGSSNWTCT
jgi:hypothetical protein